MVGALDQAALLVLLLPPRGSTISEKWLSDDCAVFQNSSFWRGNCFLRGITQVQKVGTNRTGRSTPEPDVAPVPP